MNTENLRELSTIELSNISGGQEEGSYGWGYHLGQFYGSGASLNWFGFAYIRR